jgi:hypothetical protein
MFKPRLLNTLTKYLFYSLKYKYLLLELMDYNLLIKKLIFTHSLLGI